ncbi:hypothetical protein Smp_151660 [Schistosoma mansoni]|uniref:Protein kinase domain-containing protein n=1 Tax=Schistosoma mansoni TaxID=6183 RepID=G4V5W1_SCHMA|nr:hypothetical protein Smp_151660 [Schistosoma mansoni]|eukprot:XP_018647549.1 hypothetical protein Smp_151660 [Schistosoma mansoni]
MLTQSINNFIGNLKYENKVNINILEVYSTQNIKIEYRRIDYKDHEMIHDCHDDYKIESLFLTFKSLSSIIESSKPLVILTKINPNETTTDQSFSVFPQYICKNRIDFVQTDLGNIISDRTKRNQLPHSITGVDSRQYQISDKINDNIDLLKKKLIKPFVLKNLRLHMIKDNLATAVSTMCKEVKKETQYSYMKPSCEFIKMKESISFYPKLSENVFLLTSIDNRRNSSNSMCKRIKPTEPIMKTMNVDTDMETNIIDENEENDEILRSHTKCETTSVQSTENIKQNIVTTMWPDSGEQMGLSHDTFQLQTVLNHDEISPIGSSQFSYRKRQTKSLHLYGSTKHMIPNDSFFINPTTKQHTHCNVLIDNQSTNQQVSSPGFSAQQNVKTLNVIGGAFSKDLQSDISPSDFSENTYRNCIESLSFVCSSLPSSSNVLSQFEVADTCDIESTGFSNHFHRNVSPVIYGNLCCSPSVNTQDVATSSIQKTFHGKWGNEDLRVCCFCDYSQDFCLPPCYNNSSPFSDCYQSHIFTSHSPSIHCRSSEVPHNCCQNASCISEVNTIMHGIFDWELQNIQKSSQLYQTMVCEERMKSDHSRNSSLTDKSTDNHEPLGTVLFCPWDKCNSTNSVNCSCSFLQWVEETYLNTSYQGIPGDDCCCDVDIMYVPDSKPVVWASLSLLTKKLNNC